jgi:trigger factor
LNVQTERLENHTARLTVAIEAERLEKAKQEAARKLARRMNIPGFRKGKAPYRVVVSYLGEGAILEDAVEALGNEVYRDVLKQSEVEPYGPGSLEDFDLEPQPTFTFVVPLQPVVDLNQYREVRVEYTAPVVEDKAVEDRLRALQEREAVVEESSQPVAPGNRVTVSMKGVYLDDPLAADAEAEEAEADAAEEAADARTVLEAEAEAEAIEDSAEADETNDEDDDENERIFIDNDHLVFSLTPEREPAPGFTDALVGAVVGERREFELTYPDDQEEYQHLAGRHVRFDVTIKKIETVTLPELNDDFAARVTKEEQEQAGAEPLTLLQLRMKIREELQKEREEAATAEYAEQVLNKIIEQTTFSFPDALVHDEVDHMLRHVDSDLRRRGITLDDYMKITGKTHEDLHTDYHESAVASIKRSLTLRELIKAERLVVDEAMVNAEVDRIAGRFGEQADAFRGMYSSGAMRDNLRNDLGYRLIIERVASIGKGEAPVLSDVETAPATTGDESVQEAQEGDSA